MLLRKRELPAHWQARIDRGGAWLWLGLLTSLGLLLALPAWLVRFFPSQDGPSHLYNTHVLLTHADPSNYVLRQAFELNLGLLPNLLGQIILGGLMLVFPPIVAEKLLVTGLIVLLPVSLWYFAGALGRNARWAAAVGLVFALHNLLHMGFYNFTLSIPMMFFAVGYWLRVRRSLTPRRIGVFIVLMLLLWLSHFSCYASGLILLGVFWGIDLLLPAGWQLGPAPALSSAPETSRDRERAGQLGERDDDADEAGGTRARAEGARWRGLAAHFRIAVLQAAVLLPVGLAGLVYYRLAHGDGREGFAGDGYLSDLFWHGLVMVSYREEHRFVADALWLLFFLAIGANVVTRIVRKQWISRRDALLPAAVALGVVYFSLPRFSSGGGWINDRVLLVLAIFVWFWFERLRWSVQAVLVAALISLALWHGLKLSQSYMLLQPELETFAVAIEKVPPHSTLKREKPGNFSQTEAWEGNTQNVTPFIHMISHYALKKDIVLLDNYEAQYHYFPLNWRKARLRHVDYVLAWRRGYDDKLRKDYRDHEVIYRNRYLTLLGPKSRGDVSTPGRAIEQHGEVRLILSDHPDRDPKTIALGSRRNYRFGEAGWMERGALDERGGAGIGSREPGLLGVDLPDGRYLLQFTFRSDGRGPYAVDILGNGEPLVATPPIPENGFVGYQQAEAVVEGGRLDLQFWPRWEQGNDPTRSGYWRCREVLIRPAQEGTPRDALVWIEQSDPDDVDGDWAESATVTLSSDDEGAQVRYTTDGSTPTAESEVASEAIEITVDCTLKARAFRDGKPAGPVASARYRILQAASKAWKPAVALERGFEWELLRPVAPAAAAPPSPAPEPEAAQAPPEEGATPGDEPDSAQSPPAEEGEPSSPPEPESIASGSAEDLRDLPAASEDDIIRVTAYVRIDRGGVHSFRTEREGVSATMGGVAIGPTDVRVYVASGVYPIEVSWPARLWTGRDLPLRWSGPGARHSRVPAYLLWR